MIPGHRRRAGPIGRPPTAATLIAMGGRLATLRDTGFPISGLVSMRDVTDGRTYYVISRRSPCANFGKSPHLDYVPVRVLWTRRFLRRLALNLPRVGRRAALLPAPRTASCTPTPLEHSPCSPIDTPHTPPPPPPP